MTKSIFSFVIAVITFTSAQAQTTWLFDKTIKNVSFLGQGISKYNKRTKEFERDPISEANRVQVKIDKSRLSNSQVDEFQYQSREYVMSFFSSMPVRITNVTMINPIEYSLNFETVRAMPNNDYFVFAGQSADSVAFTFSFARETNTDVAKMLETVSSVLTSAGVNMSTVSKFIPLFDSASVRTLDSLRYRLYMKDPNALFRVQVLKKKNTKFDPSGNNYRLYFPPLNSSVANIPDTTFLTYGKLNALTQPETPKFGWMAMANNNIAFKLKLDKKNGNLELGVDFNDGSPRYVLFERKNNGENNFWQETKLVHSFKGNSKIRKLIYVSIFAEQTSNNDVRVINKMTNSDFETKVSYMAYPEIKVKYLK